MFYYVPRGPIAQQRVDAALEYLPVAADFYEKSTLPKPFGQFREAIGAAKDAGTTCEEICVILESRKCIP